MDENEKILSGEQPEREGAPAEKKPGVGERIEAFFTVENLKALFSRENRKKTIAVILGVIVVIGVVCGVISYNSPASVAQRFAKTWCVSDYKVNDSTLVGGKYYWFGDEDEQEWLEEQSNWYDEDFLSMSDYYNYMKTERDDTLYDEYGEYKITTRVSKEKDVRVGKLLDDDDIVETLDTLDIDEGRVKAAKLVTVKLHIDGEDDSDRWTLEVQLVRIGLAWKVIDWD